MGHKHPVKRLMAVKVKHAKPGKYADGGGLYLRVTDDGRRTWVLRIVIKGKRCELGLGPVDTVSLAEARQEGARLRGIARKGGDPLAERRRERKAVPTFEEAARKVHAEHSKTFRNKKHADQWINTLRDYAFPVFGSKLVDQVESSDVLTALSRIWIEKPETARRVKQRIRSVFSWVRVNGFRPDNPAEDVKAALPRHSDRKKHHAALPYAQVPEFILKLWQSGVGLPSKFALEFLILTASRTSEVLLADWREIDIGAATWTVPAERMKAKIEHRVPLSDRCLGILNAIKTLSHGKGYIFPGRSEGKALSNMALEMALRRMGRSDITVHGFRSSFRDWAEERTSTQRSVVEAALAHTIENKVEAAYLRTTLFEKRRRLMESWAAYAMQRPAEKVVRIDGRA